MHHSWFPMILGGYLLKKQRLDDRRFPKMHLNLQRLLQVSFPFSPGWLDWVAELWRCFECAFCIKKWPESIIDLLQVIAHGEQVFPRVKDKCAQRTWFAREDIGYRWCEQKIGEKCKALSRKPPSHRTFRQTYYLKARICSEMQAIFNVAEF